MVLALIGSTVFLRTKLHTSNGGDGAVYIGALLFSLNTNLLNGLAESPIITVRFPVFFKHRDLLLYPPWVFTLAHFLTRIPFSLLESVVWAVVTYFVTGFAPEASRFFKQVLLVFLVQQMAEGLFRAISGLCRSMALVNIFGPLSVIFMFGLSGFLLPRGEIPSWWIWGYWISPLTYAYNALVVNEMLSPRWMNKLAPDGQRLGAVVLESFDVFIDSNWYWIGAGALLGYIILFNTLFTLSLMYLNPLVKPHIMISEEAVKLKEAYQEEKKESPRLRERIRSLSNGSIRRVSSYIDQDKPLESVIRLSSISSMKFNSEAVLPFTLLAMSFEDVNYYVDMPLELRRQGVTEERLQLLRGVTGVFRPGVLTALMGISGSGKTTLMDVLAGRKTGGYIEGEIRVSGYPKDQATFSRVSGYCEQTDVHSPQITVKESLIFSAFLRLPKEVSVEAKMRFIDEVMGLVELEKLKDAIVGMPGVTGLSMEQRKRLTIAVELVANPSIIFMDEPTSGFDARAAAKVMRTVRNTVDTGRTVICTIHQPGIDVFESFDELLLMRKGGQVTYFGPLGQNSQQLIEYFEAIPGVPKIKEKYNPATWMMEVSSADNETRLGIDFSVHYGSSRLCKLNTLLVKELSKPITGSSNLYFKTRYAQSAFEQFKYCLLKQSWNYWRSPEYNLTRFFFSFATSLLVGTIFWKAAKKRESPNDLMVVIGAMYLPILFVGIVNCVSAQLLVAVERMVFYRERAAGLYSAVPYAISLVVVEIPYVLVQAVSYTLIVYPMMGLEWTAVKVLWFCYISFFTFLSFTYFGMTSIAMAPSPPVSGIVTATFYSLFNLFSGFAIPKALIPTWWIWCYWICPVAWTVYGLILTQYGDVEDLIKVPGVPDQSIKSFVEGHFGYDLDFVGVVAAVLVGFAVFFASMFTYCIKTLNFQ